MPIELSRPSRAHRARRAAAAAALVLGLAGSVSSASAAPPDGPAAAARSAEARAWVGRSCPPTGCATRPGAPLASALGFAFAASLAGLTARSRGDRSA